MCEVSLYEPNVEVSHHHSFNVSVPLKVGVKVSLYTKCES